MFGNVTGGGTLSSKTDYAPTPYVPVVMSSILEINSLESLSPEQYVLYSVILPQDLYYLSTVL